MVSSVTAELVYCAFGQTTGSGTGFHLSLKTYEDDFISLLFANPNNIPILKLIVKCFQRISRSCPVSAIKNTVRQLSISAVRYISTY